MSYVRQSHNWRFLLKTFLLSPPSALREIYAGKF
jgi:hypothetical protein